MSSIYVFALQLHIETFLVAVPYVKLGVHSDDNLAFIAQYSLGGNVVTIEYHE